MSGNLSLEMTFDNREFAALVNKMAEVKNVPIEKVVRNCARDFTKAAYNATHVAVKKTKWLRVYDLAGRRVKFVNIEHAPWSGQMPIRYKNKKRVYHRKTDKALVGVQYRGFAKSSWIGTMKALGMNSGSSRRGGASAAAALATARSSGSRIDYATVITNAVPYIGKLELRDHMVQIGLTAAQRQMARELARVAAAQQKAWLRK
jgi:hypothetical protein